MKKHATPSTREMDRINWMEFSEWVPAKINTVLLTLGTLEPHGVTANGTDIFAPVAAHLATGTPIESVGPRIVDFIKRPFPAPRQQGDRVLGTVLRIDKFGNIITNLRLNDIGREFSITVAGLPITKLCAS